MSSVIRKLEENELADFARISVNAFCSEGSFENAANGCTDFFQMLYHHAPEQHIHGIFRDDRLVGGMRMIDYQMNVRNRMVPIGGVAGVAVDLIHKREKAAKELMQYFVRYYRSKGAVMTVLYPFQAGFYRRMGFGLGTEIREYQIRPSALPKVKTKSNLAYVDKSELNAINDCYNRFAEKRIGMTYKTGLDFFWLFHEGSNRIVAYKKNDKVYGYISFTFKNEGINNHAIIVNEWIYETRDTLLALCTFLHDQADQVDKIIIKSQDENLHFLFEEPSNGRFMLVHDMSQTLMGDVAVGMMYRVINTRKLFELLDKACFGDIECTVKLSVKDSFIEENNDSLIVRFSKGKATILQTEDYEVEVSLSIDNFSSMLMGAVSFERLYSLGLAEIDRADYVKEISRLFASDTKPMCVSVF